MTLLTPLAPVRARPAPLGATVVALAALGVFAWALAHRERWTRLRQAFRDRRRP